MCYGVFPATVAIKPFRPMAVALCTTSVRSAASGPKQSARSVEKTQSDPKRTKRFPGFAHVSWEPKKPDASPSQGLEGALTASRQPSRIRDKSTDETRVSTKEISYSVVIAGFARRGLPEAAASWLEAMVDDDMPPNVFVFNAVIATFAGHGNVAEATAWLRRMEEAGLEPNIASLNSIIDSCAKAGHAAEAERWFHSISERNLQPDRVSYNTVINAFARCGDYQGASLWLEQMRSVMEPDQVSYNSVLNSCAVAKESRRDEAERVFKEMSSRGLPASAASLTSLERAVGTDRRDEICAELRIDVQEVLAASKRTHRKVKPLARSAQ